MDIETLSIGNYTQLCTVVRSLCIVCATFYNCKKFTCTRARHAKYQIFFCELKALVTTNDKVHTVNSAYPWHALEDVEEFLPPSS